MRLFYTVYLLTVKKITTEVFEKYANVIFDEAENRLHVQKAILVKLLEK